VIVARVAGSDIKTDLTSGDVIRSVNGTAVTSIEGLRSMMDNLSPGDSVVLQIERRRQFLYVPVDID
jgi:S1-C subfamily serine protease